MVATYDYVNPVIAVVLGWIIAGESLTGQMLIGAGIVVGSGVLITSQNCKEKKTEKDDINESIGTGRPISASA
jgi:drug/metabolite transporter (DMT)-like permease